MQEKITMKNKDTINQRIKIVRIDNNLSQEQFADAISVTRATISQIELGHQQPTVEAIRSIVRIFNISYSWLMDATEETAPIKEYKSLENKPATVIKESKDLINKSDKIVPVVVDSEGNNQISILDIQAAAGLPANFDNPAYFSQLPVFSMPWPQFKSGDYTLIQITGDSMQPTIYHSDWVICKRLNTFLDIRDGYIHVVVTRDGVVCKRVLNRVDKRAALALQSDNDQYATYDQPISEILQIWKVELKLSAILRNENSDIRKELNAVKKDVSSIKTHLSL
jgi:transcriptional regulator with XRE-family HTH domain